MEDTEENEHDALRDVLEESREGAPSAGSVISDRFDTNEIFHRIMSAADEEIQTSFRELFFSALAGGFAITITFLLYANLYHSTGGHPVLSALLYPIGFVYIILGRYQLYTENTLPPVTLVLERLASIPMLLYVWVVVFAGNALGGGLGAIVLASTGVFSPEVAKSATELAMKGMQVPFWSLFWKAGFAGLIVAGVVWLDYAARDTASRFFLIYMAFLAIPMGDLYHSVVAVTETIYLVCLGHVGLLAGLQQFVLPVLLGNTLGGVLLVTVVNYFQTERRRVQAIREQGVQAQLTISELLLGPFVGRAYSAPDETHGSGGNAS